MYILPILLYFGLLMMLFIVEKNKHLIYFYRFVDDGIVIHLCSCMVKDPEAGLAKTGCPVSLRMQPPL